MRTLAWKPKLTWPRTGTAASTGSGRGVVSRHVRERPDGHAWWPSGCIQRGRLGRGVDGPHVFRLTALGYAVFVLGDCAAPGAGRGLLPRGPTQLRSPGLRGSGGRRLGRFYGGRAIRPRRDRSRRSGSRRPASPTRSQESGLSDDRIVAYASNTPAAVPANVLRSLADWSGEVARSRAVRSESSTVLGFPSELFPRLSRS